jgi:hypothetical protein
MGIERRQPIGFVRLLAPPRRSAKTARPVAVRLTELGHVTILFVRHRIFFLALLDFFAQHHDDHLRE